MPSERQREWDKRRSAKRKASGYWRSPERRDANRRNHQRLKTEVFNAYSDGGVAHCQCCGETDIRFLTLDHVENGGRKHRAELQGRNFYRRLKITDFPKEPPLRVLCFNCNGGRTTNEGVCPHNGRRLEPFTFIA